MRNSQINFYKSCASTSYDFAICRRVSLNACLVLYTSTKIKSSLYVEFQVSPTWRKCAIFFSAIFFFIAIGEWRSVSVNQEWCTITSAYLISDIAYTIFWYIIIIYLLSFWYLFFLAGILFALLCMLAIWTMSSIRHTGMPPILWCRYDQPCLTLLTRLLKWGSMRI